MGAIVRIDLPKGLSADLHKWEWESRKDYDAKEGKPDAEKIVDIESMDKIKGSFYQSTTAITADKLEDKNDYGVSLEDTPQEGFTVYGIKKQKSIKTAISAEVANDWHRTANFLKSYVQNNVPEMLYNTKDDIVFTALNKGGFTSGHSIFDNNSSDMGVPAQTANLPYDGVSWFNTAHTNKVGSSYDNDMAVTTNSPSGQANGINYENGVAMYVRFTGTNAKKENDSNFNNKKDIYVVSSVQGALDWDTVINSTLVADNANNANNVLKGKIKGVIGSNLITTETQSVMFRKKGIKFFISETHYEYWEEKEPDKFWFRVSFEYIFVIDNFRFALANNAPNS